MRIAHRISWLLGIFVLTACSAQPEQEKSALTKSLEEPPVNSCAARNKTPIQVCNLMLGGRMMSCREQCR